MGRREIELRDAMANALAAARVSGGQFRQLVPIYSDRLGLAYQVMRGEQIRRMGRRWIAITAIVATVSGAAAAVVAERMIAHRRSDEAAESEAKDESVTSEAAFSG
ncbi:hypothetical protein [Paractinoplanes globisporus]|jgi:hypothetical protein|uniref:Uncharacterized protein n=1 Tax=Paractinoplanes globisporus TaxID=113565 RepID=A0ABW6WRD1_9ACTN|nr:hypothetical protein [Actinoplanes globisporus]